ncbi:MAG: hypothetical protein ABJE95_38840, partial [Byssovorax sp.]
YSERILVPGLAAEGTLEERIARLRVAVSREVEGLVEKLPSARLTRGQIASYRATLGGDADQEQALSCLLGYLEEVPPFVDFLFLLRAEVYARLADRAALAQAELDDTVLDVLSPWAGKYGYAGIRKIVDRDPGNVFTDSIRRGELQYDYFFRGQLFETVAAPGYNIHGSFPHVLQWLYLSWRHDREAPVRGGVNQAMSRIYRKIPEVTGCELFRRVSDTFNSPVQLQLVPGQSPNFPAMAVNYRGFPRSLTDPATITRLFELVLYNSLDPARPVPLEPMQVMIVRPQPEEIDALYVPETDDEKRSWSARAQTP